MTGRRTQIAAGLAAVLLLACGVIALVRLLPGEREFAPLAIEVRQQDQLRAGSDSATVSPAAHSVGQVFVSAHANLSSVAVQLRSYSFRPPTGGRFHLQAGSAPDAPDVVTLPLTAADFDTNPYLTFHFAPLPDSAGRTYRLRIETAAPLAPVMAIELAPYDAYSEGTALIDGVAQPGDLAFRTFYAYTPGNLLADVGAALSSQAGLALAALAFLLLPGRLLARAMGRAWTPVDRWLAAPGLILLCWPVLLLAGWAAGIPGWGPWLVWAVVLAGAAGLLIGDRGSGIGDRGSGIGDRTGTRPVGLSRRFVRLPIPDPRSPIPAVGAVLALTLVARLATIRDLVAGMGLDAYHHTLVTALFLDRGGVPHDYQPYAPLLSFTYHFGFHAFAAALGWLAPGALPVEKLMVLAGQLSTALPVVTLAWFGTRVLGNRAVGVVAGALAGLVAIFPAFYVNWSRYTQGLGLALLPVAWVVLFDALAPVTAWRDGAPPLRAIRTGAWRTWAGPAILAAVTAAGLFLTHYRIAALFAVYAGLFLLAVLARAVRQAPRGGRGQPVGALVESGLLVTAGAVVLLLPWLINLRQNFTVRFAGSADQANAAYYDLHAMLGDVPLAYWSTVPLLVLAAAGLLWCLVRRDWPPVLLAAAFALLLLWSNPTWLHLPGAGYVDTVTVVTSAFMPVCVLAAYPLVGLARLLARGVAHPAWPAASGAALAAGGFLLLALSGLRLLPILDVRPYVAPQDLAGMVWLRTHTPPGALVLGNGFGWPWGPEAVQGSDTGVWTPVLAGRPSTVPPIPAYNERLADPQYLGRAAQIVRASAALQNPSNWAYLRAQGIRYLYVGSRGGVLDPAILLALPDQVQQVFHQDDVWVFALR